MQVPLPVLIESWCRSARRNPTSGIEVDEDEEDEPPGHGIEVVYWLVVGLSIDDEPELGVEVAGVDVPALASAITVAASGAEVVDMSVPASAAGASVSAARAAPARIAMGVKRRAAMG